MTVSTSAGTTLAIPSAATPPSSQDASGYNALTYVNIGEITDLGEIGKEYNLVTHSPLGSRRIQKFKGSYNNGSMAVQMGRDLTDAGQVILRTASGLDSPYPMRITLQNGVKLYFMGMVMSFKATVGGVDSITGATCQIEVTSEIVEV